MPKCVPPESCFNSEFPSCWSQILVQNCLSPIRLHPVAMMACKNPVFWLAISGLFFPLDQGLRNYWVDRDRLLRGFCFARAHETVDDGAHYAHCSCRKIDIAPFQSKQFALPDAS